VAVGRKAQRQGDREEHQKKRRNMSTRKGGVTRGNPKHQNASAALYPTSVFCNHPKLFPLQLCSSFSDLLLQFLVEEMGRSLQDAQLALSLSLPDSQMLCGYCAGLFGNRIQE
jgi:hypothetical protein